MCHLKERVAGTAWLMQIVVLVITWCHLSHANNLCASTSGTSMRTKSLPNITGSYTAFMEYWDTATQTFNFRQEYVDQASNMAAIRIYGLYDPGDVYVFISNYNTKQLFTVSQTILGKRCRASALEHYDAESFPSVFMANTSREHIASTHTLLHFGVDFHEIYQGGSFRVRGKMADKWTSCIHSNDSGTTVTTDYYFSVPGWFPDNSETRVPLRSVLTSDLPIPEAPQDLKQTTQIDYVYFSHDVSDKDKAIFETASGMYCQGRQATLTKRIPEIPEVFQFRSQRILPRRQQMGVFNIMYDYPAKLVKMETTSPSIGPRVGVNDEPARRTSISDFNAGITYLMPSETGGCDVTPISPDDFTTRYVDPDHIRLSTIKEFTRFGTGSFLYSGQVKVHGVDCDAWTGETNNFPEGLNSTSYWTWYFSTTNWTSSSSKQKQVPVYLDIKIPQKGLEFQYYIYDFHTPVWEDVDISDCYHSEESRTTIQFDLIGNLEVAQSRQKTFRQQIIQKIANVMDVSVLRISRFQSNLNWTPATVSFDLLGLPVVKGDAAPPVDPAAASASKTTVEQAVQKLNNTVNLGLVFLRFYIRNPQDDKVEQVIPIFAAPSSLQQTTRYSNGTVVKSPSDPTLTTPTCSTTTSPPSSSSSSSSSSSTVSKSGINTATSTKIPRVTFLGGVTRMRQTSSTKVPRVTFLRGVTRMRQATSTKVPRVTFLGGVTRMRQTTTSQSGQKAGKTGQCTNGHDATSSSTWSTKAVAGLCVGVAVLGLLIGVIGTGVVQGWARPCLRFKSDKSDKQNMNSYSLM